MRYLLAICLLASCSDTTDNGTTDGATALDDGAVTRGDAAVTKHDSGGTPDDASVVTQPDASVTAPDLASQPPDLATTGLFPAGTLCNDSGMARTPPSTIKHLMVVIFENKSFSSVIGSSNAPYLNSLATGCGYASDYADNCFADNLVSLPHYLALTSGSNCDTGLDQTGTGCITDDNDATAHTLNTTSIFAQVSSWKAYQESMPSACDKSSSGRYACKHNPPAYYSQLSSCSSDDIAIAAVTCSSTSTKNKCTTPSNALTDDLANDTLPALSFVTPNLDNDMHDGTVTQADNWLYTYLPLVFASNAYLRGEVAVLLVWDEQSTTSFGGATPNVFISPYITAGTVVTTKMNHFSVLRAMENALGITTYLGCASGTQPGGGSCPSGSTTDVRAAFNF